MRASWTRLAILVPAALLTARCALLPGGGAEPAWRELETPRFVVATDLHADAARGLVAELERLRALLVAAMFGRDAQVPGRVRVVAFARASEYERRTGGGFAGLTVRDGLGPPTIVLPGAFDDARRLVIAHELVHVLSAHALPRQPRWLAEGLAQFLAPVALRGDSPEVGAPPPNGAALVRLAGTVSALDALEWRWSRDLSALYAKSWLLVAYLFNERAEGLGELQDRLARAEEPARAWNAVFPEWRLDVDGATAALDQELARYAAGGRVGRVPLEAPGAEVRARVRTLGPAEQRALRVEVALVGARDEEARAELVRELDLALAADPDHVGALALKARLAPGDALSLARRAVEARPEDARAWALLARALPADAPVGEREAALRGSLSLAPEDVDVAVALAAALVARGRAGEALPLAARAARSAPWDPRAHEVHAVALARLGRCGEALATARRAIEVAWEVPEDVRRRAEAAADDVERRCVSPNPSPNPTTTSDANPSASAPSPRPSPPLRGGEGGETRTRPRTRPRPRTRTRARPPPHPGPLPRFAGAREEKPEPRPRTPTPTTTTTTDPRSAPRPGSG